MSSSSHVILILPCSAEWLGAFSVNGIALPGFLSDYYKLPYVPLPCAISFLAPFIWGDSVCYVIHIQFVAFEEEPVYFSVAVLSCHYICMPISLSLCLYPFI